MRLILGLLSFVGVRCVAAQVATSPVAGSPEESLGSFNISTRDHGGSRVPYGKLISTCVREKHIAVTFDDGPSEYTRRVLWEFSKYEREGFKATFFVVGNNLCPITESPCADLLRDVLREGHQIASHTWRHKNLDAIDTVSRHEQMNLNKIALAEALHMYGKAPTYMRPPFGSCSAETGCLEDMRQLGYHVVNWNIDTSDWQHCDSEKDCQISTALFDEQFDGRSEAGYIVLSHDVKQYTPSVLLPHILQHAKDTGFKVVTVGECLGDPKENWYRKW